MTTAAVLTQLRAEKDNLDPSFVHAARLISEEIERIERGSKYTEVHADKRVKLTERVLIPVKAMPKVNFVGKLLGPQGSTLKTMQAETGTKMSILGRGSMRDRNKEEELRSSGDAKYQHLNDDLHVCIECFSLPSEGHTRMAHALSEVQKYLHPDLMEDDSRDFMNGAGAGGPPRGRGGPSMRGRGAPALLQPPGGRGAPPPHGTPRGAPGRGGMRGAPPTRGPMRGASRGGPAGRGAPRPAAPEPDLYAAAPSYEDDYYSRGTGSSTYETPARAAPAQTYAQEYSEQDQQYYDYGASAGGDTGATYDSYAGEYTESAADYQSRPVYKAAAPSRGVGQSYRQRPY